MRSLLVIFALILIGSLTNADEISTLDSRVDTLVTLLKDAHATEFKKARHTYIDGSRAFGIVFFTLEGFDGGNNYTQYLALFRARSESTTTKSIESTFQLVAYTPVGGKAWRSVNVEKFKFEKVATGGTIELLTTNYVDGDPTCCPSKPGTVVYKFDSVKSQLIETPIN